MYGLGVGWQSSLRAPRRHAYNARKLQGLLGPQFADWPHFPDDFNPAARAGSRGSQSRARKAAAMAGIKLLAQSGRPSPAMSAFGGKAECAGRPARSRWWESITTKE
jgi:hypothetical protein